MPSRIAALCEKILEMGWLAALITAPLFFNVYSSRVFEPDKITLVRSIALVMAGAWLTQQFERGIGGLSARRWLKENPLALPTLAIVLANIVSTIFSLAPSVSLWGSYQRLQGLDSMLSYVAIFVFAAGAMRTRAQFDRAINTAILVSFPIAYYGIIQHYKLDPLPWGGDVTSRVAANMGNSIFVAAYLIMIVPLSLARWVETMSGLTGSPKSRWVLAGIIGVALVALMLTWATYFWYGLALAAVLMVGLILYGYIARVSRRDMLLVALYTIHLAVLVVAILFTQSRGPWIGIIGGVIAFGFLYPIVRGAKLISFGFVGIGALGLVFVALLNLPGSPLGQFKQIPYVARFGNLLETESGTGKVRELIWQGDIPLILPHAPLWSPTTGDDALNLLRPLIGYGPEAMYVAYNPFYPPDLAHYEARNASPDRSHNETFDSLVTTGVLGFAAYIFLFFSVCYFGLKSLGMIQSARHSVAFIALWLGGGIIAALGFGLLGRWNFFGVALPAGMILGLFVYLLIDAFWSYVSKADSQPHQTANQIDPRRALYITALLAVFIAHFIEINFGIAIVSTRVYFWSSAALLVILGMNYLRDPEAPPAAVSAPSVPAPQESRALSRRQRRARTVIKSETPREESLGATLTWTFLCTIIFVTLAYEFITVQRDASPLDILARSLFPGATSLQDLITRTFAPQDGGPSYAIFSLIALTWVAAGILGFDARLKGESRWLSVAIFVVLSFTLTMWFVLFQTNLLKDLDKLPDAFATLGRFSNLLALYYASLFLLILAAAIAQWFDSARTSLEFARTSATLVLTPIVLLVAVVMIYLTNFSAIIGDVYYKFGTNFDATANWAQSIDIYRRALNCPVGRSTTDCQSDQDFYYLFLGRAYLEAARTISDANQRLQVLKLSEDTLFRARKLNPLNTDHSANLARLNRIWGTITDSPSEKADRLKKSSDFYKDATRLSPNTAHLYNEWSQVYGLLGDTRQARAMLDKSMLLDQEFAQTYVYLGDWYSSQHDDGNALDQYIKSIQFDVNALSAPDGLPLAAPMALFTRPENLTRTIEAYRAASAKNPDSNAASLAIAELYRHANKPDQAKQELERAIENNPQDLNANLAYVNFLSTNGLIDAAVEAMRHVLEIVPPQNPDNARMQDFNNQLVNIQRAIEATRKSPNDIPAHRTLAALWRSRGQAQFALPEYQTVAKLAPNDYDALKGIALMNLVLTKVEDAQGSIIAAAAIAPDKEKAIWQNLQAALNDQKSQQFDKAVKDAQAALALAVDADQAAIQAYISQMQAQAAN